MAIIFGSHTELNEHTPQFNDALSEFEVKIAAVFSISLVSPMMLDMCFDMYQQVEDKLLWERFLFAIANIVVNGVLLIFEKDRILPQVVISLRSVRFIVLQCGLWGSLHKLKPHIWDSITVLLVTTFMDAFWIADAFLMNSHGKTFKVYMSLQFVTIFPFSIFLYLVYKTTIEAISNFKKRKRSTGYASFSSDDIIVLVMTYGFVMNGVLSSLVHVSSANLHIYTHNGKRGIAVEEYLMCVLTLCMVLYPMRVSRSETQRMKDTLEFKRKIARNVYDEMNNPLNNIVVGLNLLKTAASKKLQSIPEGIEDGAEELTGERLLRFDGGSTSLLQSNLASTKASHVTSPATLRAIEKVIGQNNQIDDLIKTIGMSSEAAVEILHEMLMLEVLDSGILKTNFEHYSIQAYIQHVMKPFQLYAGEKLVRMRFVNKLQRLGETSTSMVSEDDTQTVSNTNSRSFERYCLRLDHSKMAQVLRSFLSNAIKYTPKGGTVTVSVRLIRSETSTPVSFEANCMGRVMRKCFKYKQRFVDSFGSDSSIKAQSTVAPSADVPKGCNCKFQSSNRFVRISVTDTGAGMSRETIRNLFSDVKKYNDGIDVQGGGGSGFGLKIAQGMTELHDGRVGVSSNGVGKGSTFHVDLPLYLAEYDPLCSHTIDPSGLIASIHNVTSRSPAEMTSL